jgi:hypothetical protein
VDGQPLATTVLAFWRWAASDLISNATRGRLAEYLVAYALGVADGVRVEWDAYDVTTTSGIKVEVKSAAYLQSWKQTRLSSINFRIGPTLGWNADTNISSTIPTRQAEVYVFAVLAHCDKATLDPLNIAQWEFYVLPAAVLNTHAPTQKTMSLTMVRRLGAQQTRYADLATVIEHMGA